ncbi:MAG: hypothetical protein U0350_28590 [Caldilineaceae bacterium]
MPLRFKNWWLGQKPTLDKAAALMVSLVRSMLIGPTVPGHVRNPIYQLTLRNPCVGWVSRRTLSV